MSHVAWIVPVVLIAYLIMVVYLSGPMAKLLDTNYAVLVLVGIFFPPIWIIMGLVALSYHLQGKTMQRTRKVEIVKRKTTKSPKKK